MFPVLYIFEALGINIEMGIYLEIFVTFWNT